MRATAAAREPCAEPIPANMMSLIIIENPRMNDKTGLMYKPSLHCSRSSCRLGPSLSAGRRTAYQ
jgi:hypothetical protein